MRQDFVDEMVNQLALQKVFQRVLQHSLVRHFCHFLIWNKLSDKTCKLYHLFHSLNPIAPQETYNKKFCDVSVRYN